jgi:hypothetical protein
LNVGGDIVRGLAQGIRNAAGEVADAVAGLVNKIPGPIRKAMGIGSPSKVMRRIGEQISKGLALGIASGIPDLTKQARIVRDTVSQAGTLDITSGGATAAKLPQPIHVTLNVPPVADPAEVGRHVHRALERYGESIGRPIVVQA